MNYRQVFQKISFGARPCYKKSQWSAEQLLHFLGDKDLNRVWIGLREADTSYAGDSVELLSAAIIIAQSGMKYLMNSCFI